MTTSDREQRPRTDASPLDAGLPFARRHIGPAPEDQAKMLAVLGYSSLEDLVDAAVPASVHSDTPLALDAGRSEHQVLDELRELAGRNTVLTSMIGLGYYGTVTPPVILRNVLENPAWYTAYTPYQPEISQGRLEALLNFQTVVTDLTGLPVAGASLLDESTAAAEAMTLARRTSRAPADAVFVVDTDVLPQTLAVVQTRAEPLGLEVVVADVHAGGLPDRDTFGVLLQYPGTSGVVRDLGDVVTEAKEKGAVVAVAADLLALTLLRSPGEMGADIAVGTTQRFGVPMGFGGPHAGYMSVRKGLERSMPGRLVGVSVDADGAPGLPARAADPRAAHPPREGHAATSAPRRCCSRSWPACTPSTTGPTACGRSRGAPTRTPRPWRRVWQRSAAPRSCTTRSSTPSSSVSPAAPPRSWPPPLERGVNLRHVDADHVAVASDETTVRDDLAAVLAAFGAGSAVDALDTTDRLPDRTAAPRRRRGAHPPGLPPAPLRDRDAALPAPAADKDHALDRGMIPLGSCTMKLNATTEMEPITWPEFAAVHPFAPADQAEGYPELIRSAGGVARRGHRLRRGVPAAQRRFAGRARRTARDPRLPPRQRRRRAHRLPDPVLRARHQRRVSGDGRA